MDATTTQPRVGAEPFDPHRAEHLRDPYSLLARLREEGPCWVDPVSGTGFLLSFERLTAEGDR